MGDVVSPRTRLEPRSPGPSVVMLVRHAEKPLGAGPPHGVTIDGTPDPESLTPRGWQRAGALVALSSEMGVAGA